MFMLQLKLDAACPRSHASLLTVSRRKRGSDCLPGIQSSFYMFFYASRAQYIYIDMYIVFHRCFALRISRFPCIAGWKIFILKLNLKINPMTRRSLWSSHEPVQ